MSRDVVASFLASGPTEAELKAAKDNLIGGFALRIDSNLKLQPQNMVTVVLGAAPAGK